MTNDTLPRLALSIRQPWAYAFCYLGKDIENRSWLTKYRGPICIHASMGMKKSEFDGFMALIDQILPMPEVADIRANIIYNNITKSNMRGGIIATAELTDCVTEHQSKWFFGHFGFVLENVKTVPFIAVRGSLGLFDWRKNLIGTSLNDGTGAA
jgi:hypothetical protein